MKIHARPTLQRLTRALLLAGLLGAGAFLSTPRGEAAVNLPGEGSSWEVTPESFERTVAGDCDSYGPDWICREMCDFGVPTGTFRCFES